MPTPLFPTATNRTVPSMIGTESNTGGIKPLDFSTPSIGQGYAKFGYALASGLWQQLLNYKKDVDSFAAKAPTPALAPFYAAAAGVREPLWGGTKALVQMPAQALSMPVLSMAQAITNKKQKYNIPVLGELSSYQEQAKQLSKSFGPGVGYTFPIVQEALNVWGSLPQKLPMEVLGILPKAEAGSVVKEILGDAAKSVSKADLGTFENMIRTQAAKNKLLLSNPESINIPKLIEGGATASIAQDSANKAIIDTAKGVSREEMLNTASQIIKDLGETPGEISQSLPNFLSKLKQFQNLAPRISEATGIPIEKLILNRGDAAMDTDVLAAIDYAKTLNFGGGVNDAGEAYRSAIGDLYNKYPWLEFHRDLLEPYTSFRTSSLKKGLTAEDVAAGEESFRAKVEPIGSKQDLLDRLSALENRVNKEVQLPKTASTELASEVSSLKTGVPRGYKIGFSPHEYTAVIPVSETPLPSQNFLGRMADYLGLRGVDQQRINLAWKEKFQNLFNKAFPKGLSAEDGTLYSLKQSEPVFAKSGRVTGYEGSDITSKLYDLARANNRVSVTELSPKILDEFFGKDASKQLYDVIKQSRVLPSSLEGIGVTTINKLRATNKFFDDFYRATLTGRFSLSPGFAIRHTFKNQLLGAFEGKPLNMIALADTDLFKSLIKKFPKVFGGEAPTVSELNALKKVSGNMSLSLDPASEAFIYSHFGDKEINMAIKETIKSPNFFERMLGYTQTQDVVDLARTFARKNGTTIEEIATTGRLKPELEDIIKNTYSYPKGFLSSPAIRTLNTVLYPIRFEAKVLRATARWWSNAPVLTKSITLKMINESLANAQTPGAKKFMKDHSTLLRVMAYLMPYPTMLNVFQDVMNTIGSINRPSQIASNIYSSITDNYELGGIFYGIIIREAQDQGLLPQTEYINPAGKKYPIYIPKGVQSRFQMFLADLLSFVWPQGLSIMGTIPGGIGQSINQMLPNNPQYLKSHYKVKSGQSILTGQFKP